MDENNDNNIQSTLDYAEKGKKGFKEGNPGRPDGCKNKYTIAKLEEAIEAQEKIAKKQGGVGLFEQYVKMATVNSAVMISLMGKFIANKEKVEHSTDGPLQIEIKRVDAENND